MFFQRTFLFTLFLIVLVSMVDGRVFDWRKPKESGELIWQLEKKCRYERCLLEFKDHNHCQGTGTFYYWVRMKALLHQQEPCLTLFLL